MCSFQAQTSLEERQDFVEVSLALICLDNGREFFCVDDDVETTNLREAELALLQTSCMNLLPDPAPMMSSV